MGLKERITLSNQSKIYSWGKLLAVTGSAQSIVQLVTMIAGILIIRLLPTQEYAFYTLANAMLGMMTVLADGGISSGVMAYGGKVWQDREKLGVVLATGLDLRRKFAIVSLLVTGPFLVYLLASHDASVTTIILIIISLIPAFFSALSDSILEIIPKLHQDINSLQKNQIAVGVGRLVFTSLIFLVPFSFVAILVNGLVRAYGNIRLRSISKKFVDSSQKASGETKSDILKIVKRLLPTAIYYCLSGQITIWLISIFGNTKSVAQIGALSRLSVILTLFTAIFNTLIIPRFSRLGDARPKLNKLSVTIHLAVAFGCCLIVLLTYLFPSQLLFILGEKYKGLDYELVLTVTGSCISLLTGLTFSMYVCRGWAIHPAISIPVNIAAILTSALIFKINTLDGVLLLNIATAFVQYIMNLIFLFLKINR